MNIGMILDSTFPPDPRVESEAVTLINAGFEVTLFCLDYTSESDSREVINGIKIYRKSCPYWVYKFSALAYTVPVYHKVLKKWIGEFIDKARVDALHIHDIQVAKAVFDLPASKEMSVVLDLHEMRPEIMKYYNHLTTWPGKWLINPERWATYESKYIIESTRTIVVTREARNYYMEKLMLDANKFILLPNTVRRSFKEDADIDATILERYKDQFVILYVGDTGLRRGLMTAINGMTDIIKEIPNVKLVLVGSNKSDEVLKKQVEDLGLRAYVDFEGWQDFNLFQSYISASEICISPLHRNLHHDTTFANKIFQYMAFAKPMVVSDCEAQHIVVEKANGGLVHEAENVEDFVDKILTLYRDKDLREDMGRDGQRFVENRYNWEKKSEGLVNYYKEIAEHVI